LAATNNPDKLREIKAILNGAGWVLLSLADFPPFPEPEEDGATLVENAMIKAREGFRQTGLITLADDTGLEVDALGGKPGVYSARFAGEAATYQDNVNRLLRELQGIPSEKRTATFRCVMALVGEGMELWWRGDVQGVILSEPKGTSGFGYDPVFWCPELDKTFAEATLGEKNRVSHRARALAELKTQLIELEK